MRALFVLVLSGCTLVVGSDPRVDEADSGADAAPDVVGSEGAAPDAKKQDDTSTLPSTCDAGGCNVAKEACKKTCADTAKTCDDACKKDHDDGDEEKLCHDACHQQQGTCSAACVATCAQCISGCGTCSP